MLSETLRQLEAMLELAAFFRLNRSEMVYLLAVERLESYVNDRLVVHLKD